MAYFISVFRKIFLPVENLKKSKFKKSLDIGSFSKFGSPCIVNPDYFPELTNKNRYNAIQVNSIFYLLNLKKH